MRIDPHSRRLVVGPRRALGVERMRVEDLSWLGENQRDVEVKVRSLAPAVPARIDGEWVEFDRPEYGVAPGQAAVFYDGTRVLGGGWIAQTETDGSRIACAAAA